jgi:hypothetical protein
MLPCCLKSLLFLNSISSFSFKCFKSIVNYLLLFLSLLVICLSFEAHVILDNLSATKGIGHSGTLRILWDFPHARRSVLLGDHEAVGGVVVRIRFLVGATIGWRFEGALLEVFWFRIKLSLRELLGFYALLKLHFVIMC